MLTKKLTAVLALLILTAYNDLKNLVKMELR